ncbi:MAG TPA: SAM-dependent methyltransferase [Microthrixaceae bacterium]|nr:SAM-dependent methyltransferase [Microthrixaceae bacterium]
MKPQIHVIGLGPGGPDLVTAGALELINSIPTQFLRTERHPAASVMPHAQWFDLLYESADSMEQVYSSIVEALFRSAQSNGEVLYAVPGSPVVAEHTVELLIADERLTTIIHPALSFLDLTWARLGVDPVEMGVSLIDGHRFESAVAGSAGPFLVGQCDSSFVLSDIKLSVEDEPAEPVTVLQRLGLPDEAIFTVAWQDLDRAFEPDHLTSLWIPKLGSTVAGDMARLVERVAQTRSQRSSTGSTQIDFSLSGKAVGDARGKFDPESGDGTEELLNGLGCMLVDLLLAVDDAESAGWLGLTEVLANALDRLAEE